MNDKQFNINTPIKVEGLAELAQQMPDFQWRELRVYFRKTAAGGVEITFGQQLKVVQIGAN